MALVDGAVCGKEIEVLFSCRNKKRSKSNDSTSGRAGCGQTQHTFWVPHITSLSSRENYRERVVVVRSICCLSGNGCSRRGRVIAISRQVSYRFKRGGFGIECVVVVGRAVVVNSHGSHDV